MRTNWKLIAIMFALVSIVSTASARYWNTEYNRGITCPHCGHPVQGLIHK